MRIIKLVIDEARQSFNVGVVGCVPQWALKPNPCRLFGPFRTCGFTTGRPEIIYQAQFPVGINSTTFWCHHSSQGMLACVDFCWSMWASNRAIQPLHTISMLKRASTYFFSFAINVMMGFTFVLIGVVKHDWLIFLRFDIQVPRCNPAIRDIVPKFIIDHHISKW